MSSSEKEINNVFHQLDRDGNGFISADELKQGMMASLEKKIQKLIDEADVDGDGQINYLEFHNVNKVSPMNNRVLVPPKPPDGGWGWAIVFSCFMCNFIIGWYQLIFDMYLVILIKKSNKISNFFFRRIWLYIWCSFRSFN